MSFEKTPNLIEEEELDMTPAMEAVYNMELGLDDREFQKQSIEGETDSRELSQEALVRYIKSLIDSPDKVSGNVWGSMLSILDRDSMKDHPQRQDFVQAIKDLHDRLLGEDKGNHQEYWDNLE